MGADGTIVRVASGIVGAETLGQHVYASLLMSTEAGTEAHTIVDATPGERGLEAWGRLAKRFDWVSAQGNLNLMSRILKPPSGKADNTSLFIEKWEETAKHQDE